jgi:Tfp pilus assembly protein PilF
MSGHWSGMSPVPDPRGEPTSAGRVSTAFSFLGRRQPDVARRLAQDALSANPRDADAHAVLALVELANGNPRVAVERATEAVGFGPDLPIPLATLVQASLAGGDLDTARRAAERLMTTQPQNALSFGLAATVELERGRFPEAARLASEGVHVDPSSSMCHGIVGLAYSFMGEHQAAIRAMRASVRANPTGSDARSNLGFVIGGTGEWERASRYYREAAGLDPGNVTAVRNFEGTAKRNADPTVDLLGVRIFWRFAPLWQRLSAIAVLALSTPVWLPALPALAWSIASWAVELRTLRFLTPTHPGLARVPVWIGLAAAAAALLLAEFPEAVGVAVMGLAYGLTLIAALSFRRPRLRTPSLAVVLLLAAIPAFAGVAWPSVRADVPLAIVWLNAVGLTLILMQFAARKAVNTRDAVVSR